MDLAPPLRYTRLAELALPELRALPSRDRAGALWCALAAPFDIVELVALAVALLGATTSAATAAAIGTLVLLRRTRRSLSEQAAGRAP
ncbi:MAG TPA: hypothetical protein VII68_10380 [Casimicrobiaceae bacterium]